MLYLIIRLEPILYRKLFNGCFEHSDWLEKFEQPIRVLETSATLLHMGNFHYRTLVVGSNPTAADAKAVFTLVRFTL